MPFIWRVRVFVAPINTEPGKVGQCVYFVTLLPPVSVGEMTIWFRLVRMVSPTPRYMETVTLHT